MIKILHNYYLQPIFSTNPRETNQYAATKIQKLALWIRLYIYKFNKKQYFSDFSFKKTFLINLLGISFQLSTLRC